MQLDLWGVIDIATLVIVLGVALRYGVRPQRRAAFSILATIMVVARLVGLRPDDPFWRGTMALLIVGIVAFIAEMLTYAYRRRGAHAAAGQPSPEPARAEPSPPR